jgi:hypothetical protein
MALAVAPAAVQAESVQRTHGPDRAPVTANPTATAAASAGDWCPNTDPAANQVENGEHRYRAVYVHPADRGSRLGAIGARLQDDAFGASALIERQYGRAIRFDVGTPCGPNTLDISEVRLPLTYDELAALAAQGGTATFDAVGRALREAGLGLAADTETVDQLAERRENFLVWLDGPAPSGSCGQGTALLDATRSDTNLNNFGGKLALIFRRGTDFCGADVVRHEIGHNLGALQPQAPHTTDGVHCNDAFEDTMCGVDSPKLAGGAFASVFFDYGNDDYWDPPQGPALGWWTLNLSRFICEDAECNRPDPSAAARTAAQSSAASSGSPRPVATLAQEPLRRPALVRRVSRGSRYVRLRLRATGDGSIRVVVRCRRPIHPRRSNPRRILSRRVALPATVRVRTACRSPQVRMARWHRPAAPPRS